MSYPHPYLRNLWKLTQSKLEPSTSALNNIFNEITIQCFKWGCTEIWYVRSWHKFKKEINHWSRSMTCQLLVGELATKCGSTEIGSDWINGVNTTNRHHSPILRNGQAFTNRVTIHAKSYSEAGSNGPSFWDATWPFHPESDLLQPGEGFQHQNAIHSQGHVSSFNQEFNYIVHGKKAMLSQDSHTSQA